MLECKRLKKSRCMIRLRDYKKAILEAGEPTELLQNVEKLERYLQWLKKTLADTEIQQRIGKTLEKIQQFKMHDTTRFEVCRWIQTIICVVNQS